MPAESYHYVIVGAGSAGCVLANRLSADAACRVALLEAGGPDRRREFRIPLAAIKLFQSAYDWNYRTSKQPQMSDRELYWPRGKTLGGSSSINGMAWVRGHRADYDSWAQHCPGWSYDEVLPYFHRAEHRVGSNAGGVYGTSGPQFISEPGDPNPTTSAFLAARAELGIRRLDELNEPDNTGCAPTPVTQRRGLRHSAAHAYLRPTRRRRNLTVLTGTHVQRILLDGSRAIGVEYRDAAGVTQRLTASHELILSAGTIKSPQLLMLSGIGDPDQLRAAGVEPRHELVGSARTCRTTWTPVSPFTAQSRSRWSRRSPGAQLARFLLARKGMLTSSFHEATAFVRGDPALTAPDLELVWLPVPFLGEGLAPPPAHGVTLAVLFLTPESRGHIRLASADPAEPPVIDPGYLTAESDLSPSLPAYALRNGCSMPMRCAPTSAARWRCGRAGSMMRTWRSSSGTTLRRRTTRWAAVGMGTDDGAVVDGELRVQGMEGLRVVDASVMPRITRGHPHAPTVMSAERAAELIRANSHWPKDREGRRWRSR
jgi:choline dehydrogenase